ncbi:molybdenum cofactor guanylyltransferase MobA [Sinimarinibacterium thermocellulolyticum]|uniref:Molybdenum cofactor guanylyltransferase n=1 Tax=Sinimarinibacterium thermocellulolyticum TaxID=3170016 RepID=A0ABV2ACJ0_9GAMM
MNTTADPRSRVTGVVLAGGRGLRMGGVDKGLIEIGGRALVEAPLDALRPQVGRLIVSANRNTARYAAFGVHVVADLQPDYAGPLAGLAAAAQAATTEWLVSAPCDTRTLPTDLVARLVLAAERFGVDAAYACDADGPQYVVCALRTSLAGALARAAASSRRALRDFLHAQRAVAVHFCDWRCANLNTPEALTC